MDRRTMRRAQVITGAGPVPSSICSESPSSARIPLNGAADPSYPGTSHRRVLRGSRAQDTHLHRGKGSGPSVFPLPSMAVLRRLPRHDVKWNPRREKRGQPPRCEAARHARSSYRCGSSPCAVMAIWMTSTGCGGHIPGGRTGTRPSAVNRSSVSSIVSGVGGGLDSLEVRCLTCDATRDLRDLTRPEAMKSIGVSCRGRQPWQLARRARNCDLSPVVLQRGASSVYFARIESAIDIPPESNWAKWGGPAARIKANNYFAALLSDPEHPMRAHSSRLSRRRRMSPGSVRAVLAEQLGIGASPSRPRGPADLRAREWQALISPAAEHDPRDAFVSRRVPFPSPAGHHALSAFAGELANLVSDVILVDRLREVRVLRGFYRHTMNKMVEPDLGTEVGFLPAIEVFGEGVFLRIDEEALRGVGEPRARPGTCPASSGAGWPPVSTPSGSDEEVTPRLLLIHTLGHLLMRQMSFDAGYSSSSLRERIFADDDCRLSARGAADLHGRR